MTDEQFVAWLKDSSAMRCALVEVNVKTGGVETTRYLSNKGYVTSPSDTPSNTSYQPVIRGGIKFTETLSLEGNASLSWGDIEIDNLSGDRDSWLDDVWANRAIKVFVGDVSWARSEFRLIFDGIVSGIDTKNRGRVNLKVGDKLQRLNTPITEHKLGGTTQNADKLVPLCFGECHNISPLLVDPVVNEYQVHDGPIESIIEVRDNGVPVAFTPFLSTGKFRLAAQPTGEITASVQGDKPSTYANDVASLIERIATGYGLVDRRFLSSELDTAAFDAFITANPQPVGLYVPERMNVLDALNQLAISVGARVLINRSGLLTVIKLSLPQALPGTTVTPTDIEQHSLYVSQMPNVKAGVQLGYCKNWTVQDNIAAGVPSNHADMYRQQWWTVTRTDSLTQADYKTFTEPVQEDTLLLTNADAVAETDRRLAMWSVQRKVYRYEGMPWLMLETLGASQTLQNTRFGLTAGKTGQIVSLSTDWLNPHITIEVLI
jgi:hypothetical protein